MCQGSKVFLHGDESKRGLQGGYLRQYFTPLTFLFSKYTMDDAHSRSFLETCFPFFILETTTVPILNHICNIFQE